MSYRAIALLWLGPVSLGRLLDWDLFVVLDFRQDLRSCPANIGARVHRRFLRVLLYLFD
jgi:hypothetical protein